jgi:hypothetical protein
MMNITAYTPHPNPLPQGEGGTRRETSHLPHLGGGWEGVALRAATIGRNIERRVMKSNRPSMLALVLLISVISLACSLLTRAKEIPTPNYIFTPSPILLKIEPDSLPDAQIGEEYEVEIHVRDNVTPVNSVFLSSGVLPAGLELIFVDGEDVAKISGTPEETGTFTFTVFVSCKGTMVSGQTLEQEFQIVVKE